MKNQIEKIEEEIRLLQADIRMLDNVQDELFIYRDFYKTEPLTFEELLEALRLHSRQSDLQTIFLEKLQTAKKEDAYFDDEKSDEEASLLLASEILFNWRNELFSLSKYKEREKEELKGSFAFLFSNSVK